MGLFKQLKQEIKAAAGGSGSSSAGQPYYQPQQPPQQYYAQPPPPPPQQQQLCAPPPAQGAGKINMGYYTAWSIYDRKYLPSSIPVSDLTHVLYAFADVRSESGEVFLMDAWADEQIRHPGDRPDDGSEAVGQNLHGNLLSFAKLKRENRHLKLLLSIGGWTCSSHFAPATCDAAKRSAFVRSAMKILEDYGLDGIDIDWEYPKDRNEAGCFLELLRELRAALDGHQQRKAESNRYLLTVAVSASDEHLDKLYVREMDQVLDLWNLMTYDFSGSWDPIAAHQAKLLGPAPSGEATVKSFLRRGVPAYKIVLGIPIYGRSFKGATGPGQRHKGAGKGSWEDGIYDYKALPLPGTREEVDPQLGAAFCHCAQKGEWVTYDNAATAAHKAGFIKSMGLAGAMYWELSGDAMDPGRSIVRSVARELGQLDRSENHLTYRESRFQNLATGSF